MTAASLFLSRARLRQEVALRALARLLLPVENGARTDAAHRLLWTLLGDAPDRRRDFLWREESPGRFLLLSARPPVDAHGLFELDTKPFAPALARGHRLGFLLRANPTVAVPVAPGAARRGARADVVMHALKALPAGEVRRAARPEAARAAGTAWLVRQGERAGFAPDPDRLVVDGYQTRQIPRAAGPAASFATLDFAGELTVGDPARFLAAVAAGFGRAKAFGCGLMLIRRAPR